MLLYTSSDLLWATKVKATAEALGIPARPARTLEMLRARLADSPVRALIVDLDAGPVAIELIAEAAKCAASAPLRILAFGPHVEVEALRAASAAGAHSVMTRGALAARLPEIITSLFASHQTP
ncbi:hypothetical protein BH11PLA1_BH11PLA1_01170 [soil metagenome]